MNTHKKYERNRYPLIAAAVLALCLSEVAISASSDAKSGGFGAAIVDTVITTKVKAKFIGDPQLKGSDITVKTTNGVVTLTGSADAADAADRAAALATAVEGVKSVDNEIKAPSISDRVAGSTDQILDKTQEKVSDSWITTRIKTQLFADDQIKGTDIHVNTTDGVVALSGTVQSPAQRDRTVALVSRIDGVKHVDTAALKVIGG